MDDYYSERAEEYENIYYRDDPVRQIEQKIIKEKLIDICRNNDVFEIACGTGYWTQFISESAKTILATDLSNKILNIAKKKRYKCPIMFENIDYYSLNKIEIKYKTFVGNFMFSHVLKENTDTLLMKFVESLPKGSRLIFTDNNYVEGIGGEFAKYNDDINTYKIRYLEDGSKYAIIKNYYSESELNSIFSKFGKIMDFFYGTCFWYAQIKI